MRDVTLGLSDSPPPPPSAPRKKVNRTALLGVGLLIVLIAGTIAVAYGIARADGKPRPASAAGLTVWTGGDSMSYYISTALRRELEPQGALFLQDEPQYIGGSGLLSGEFYDWTAAINRDALALDPGMIVFMIGANDANWLDPADYHQRVGAMMDSMKGDGRYVVWVGQPNMQEQAFADNVRVVNDIIREEAAQRPWVRFVDTWDASSDAAGAYSPHMKAADGTTVLARDDDGIHLTPEGGAVLADLVIREVFGE